MNIGDEINIKAEVVDFDANPHGSSIKVRVKGFVDRNIKNKPFGDQVEFWIHRVDKSKMITERKNKSNKVTSVETREIIPKEGPHKLRIVT